MRFAALADVHGNSAALDAVLADMAGQGVGAAVNLGDCLSGPLDAKGTAGRLMALGWPTVRGNHDRWLGVGDLASEWDRDAAARIGAAERAWLSALPAVLDHEGVLLCHATPGDDCTGWLHHATPEGTMRRATPQEEEAPARGLAQDLLLCAHTHIPALARISGGRLVVNPGSVGAPVREDDPPWPQRAASRVPEAQYAIVARGGGGWEVEFRRVPYDATPMIAFARAAGRDYWVTALETGFALWGDV